MEQILSTLNEEQQKALKEIDGAILVTAGAGSGKTKLLTHRISYLISNMNISPYNILALTFTNKATNEMKERILKMVEGGEKIWISTFHSMCARILRADIEYLEGYDKNFTIYSDADTDKIYKILFEKYSIDVDDKKKEVKFHISNLKNNNLNFEEYKKIYDYVRNIDIIGKIYFDYENELKKSNALDFNDLLNKTYELFTKSKDVLEKYQSRFKYVLVDEFQDTNKIQYDLVKLLCGKYKNIFVVGDEDQCIYTWRGANYSNIFDFQHDFEKVKVFKLERNYRSTKSILSLANKLIKNNKSRLEKNLWTDNESGVEPVSRLVYDEKEEAEIVVREIYDLVKNKGFKYSDFAILMRLNALSFPFEEKLLSYNIPHIIFGGMKFYERAEIKNLVSYLRIFINKKDEVSFLRIINFPKRGIGDGAISNLKLLAEQNHLGLIDAMIDIENIGAGPALIKKFVDFRHKYLKLKSEYEFMSMSDFVVSVINTFGLKDAYASRSEEDLNRLMNLGTFLSNVQDFEKSNKDATLVEFLESVTLMADIDSKDDMQNVVTIATIHSVKGLEFRYVFVVGAEEKIFPISRAFDKEDDMEEERRLMYVAITRAKERLMISRCKTRFLYGKRDYMRDSRFLRELGLASMAETVSSPLTAENSNKILKSYSYNAFSESEGYSQKPPSQYEYKPTKIDTYLENKKETVDVSKYCVGQTVLHPKFGIGEIKKIDDNKFGEIEFSGIGVKTLVLDIAPLKVLK